jgi:hypothetical protein
MTLALPMKPCSETAVPEKASAEIPNANAVIMRFIVFLLLPGLCTRAVQNTLFSMIHSQNSQCSLNTA